MVSQLGYWEFVFSIERAIQLRIPLTIISIRLADVAFQLPLNEGA